MWHCHPGSGGSFQVLADLEHAIGYRQIIPEKLQHANRQFNWLWVRLVGHSDFSKLTLTSLEWLPEAWKAAVGLQLC